MKMKPKVSVQMAPPSPPKVQQVSVSNVEIWHSQGVKLSRNYQTVDVSYGMKITVGVTQRDIQKGSDYLEEQIQKLLAPKIVEGCQFLEGLDTK